MPDRRDRILKALTPGVARLIGNLFVEGMLRPVAYESGHALRGEWTSVGIRIDPGADRLRRLRRLAEAVGATTPEADTHHRDWLSFAYRWAALGVLLLETADPARAGSGSPITDLRSAQSDADSPTTESRVRQADSDSLITGPRAAQSDSDPPTAGSRAVRADSDPPITGPPEGRASLQASSRLLAGTVRCGRNGR